MEEIIEKLKEILKDSDVRWKMLYDPRKDEYSIVIWR